MNLWNEKSYYSLDYYLKNTYKEKLYKISLNGGMTCPNRDGTLGRRGCIFCSNGGSGDFAADPVLPISSQLVYGKQLIQRKYKGSSYIAYFQAYTNTYAQPAYLRHIFTEALADPEVKILSIATRPDCLEPNIVALLKELSAHKPIWVELGLQTMHKKSSAFIRRGYDLSVFESAVSDLQDAGIHIIVHLILGLPTESSKEVLDTILYLNQLPIQGVKLQLLHILEGTDLATIYKKEPFSLPSLDEYLKLLCLCIAHLRPDIVIHRLTGDGPKSLLIAPLYTANKRLVLNSIHKMLKEEQLWQGKYYNPKERTHCYD